MTTIVFSLDNCPNCEKLKETLKANGIEFEEWDLSDKKSLFELRYRACFPKEAPVLMTDKNVYESKAIFGSLGEVKEEILNQLR